MLFLSGCPAGTSSCSSSTWSASCPCWPAVLPQCTCHGASQTWCGQLRFFFFFFFALRATRCHCRKMSCSCRLESSVSWSPAAGSSSVRPWWRSWETRSATRPSLPTTATRGCWCTTASSIDSVSQHQKQRDEVSTDSPKLTKFCKKLKFNILLYSAA